MIEKMKGLLYEDEKIEVFFGNMFYALTDLTNLKPIGVHTVKQTHSDIFHVITRQEPIHPVPEGDALGTEVRKQYLAIKTADCLPVMIHDPDGGRIAAIHAGWKGVTLGIVPKVIKNYFDSSRSLHLFIGPHITKDSFEIKMDVLDQLRNSVPPTARSALDVVTHGDRFNVDLVQIVKLQISAQFPEMQLTFNDTKVDTKTNPQYNSFRRNAANAGRNISYIRLK